MKDGFKNLKEYGAGTEYGVLDEKGDYERS